MKLRDINPYVRFARVQKTSLPRLLSVALDHRIFLCISGEFRIEIAGVPHDITEGNLLYFRAGLPYRLLSDGPLPVLLGCNFDFRYHPEKPHLPLSYIPAWHFRQELLMESDVPDCMPEVLHLIGVPAQQLFLDIIREFDAVNAFSEEMCGTWLKEILILAVRIHTEGGASVQSRIEAILEHIHTHYHEPLTNTELARQFSYHPNYISQLVKQRTGKTLHRYLLEYRIQRAIKLLQSGEYNITETADAVGFSDVKHFSKCFRKITGNPPSTFLA